ncbi:pyridoxal phosphate-dependent transferase [Baffinella frigidus]|nr:pyridoxal phosphate-dependent transferase [Cryptophyta sp. CCMP2293]
MVQEHFATNMGGDSLGWSSMYVDQLRPHVVASTVEHPAVLEVLKWLQDKDRCDVTLVEVDSLGRVSPDAVVAALRTETVLVSVMHANNEVGTVNNIAEISKRVREWCDLYGERGKQGLADGILMHTDACQSVGKIPVNVATMGVDYLSMAGHKFGAPKGIGAVYMKGGLEGPLADGNRLEPIMHGASQENGMRAGTENVALAAGLGAAVWKATEEGAVEEEGARLAALTRSLLVQLEAKCAGTVALNGPELPLSPPTDGPAGAGVWPRLPNTLSVGFPGLQAKDLLAAVQDTVCASAGAACHAGGAPKVSGVLAAMGVAESTAFGTVRFSLGRDSVEEQVTDVADAVAAAANKLRLR